MPRIELLLSTFLLSSTVVFDVEFSKVLRIIRLSHGIASAEIKQLLEQRDNETPQEMDISKSCRTIIPNKIIGFERY